jgi:hypothetical protein
MDSIFEFNEVFDKNTSNKMLIEKIINESVNNVFDVGTSKQLIIAFGPSGSGKSTLLRGSANDLGMIGYFFECLCHLNIIKSDLPTQNNGKFKNLENPLNWRLIFCFKGLLQVLKEKIKNDKYRVSIRFAEHYARDSIKELKSGKLYNTTLFNLDIFSLFNFPSKLKVLKKSLTYSI